MADEVGGAFNAGTAYVLVMPDLSRFGSQLQTQMSSASASASTQFSSQLSGQFGNAGNQAGKALSTGITTGATQANSQIRSIGTSMLYLSGQAGPVGSVFTQLGGAITEGFRRASSAAESARGRISSALQGIGAAALGLGVVFESFAGPLEKAFADIETTVANTGRSWDDYSGKVADAAKANEALGFKQADTISGLSRLTAAYGDPNKAIAENRQVLILAGAANESYADAAKQVSSALAGNFKAFKQFGINLKDNFVTQAQADSANKAYETSITSLGDAQQNLDNFEARLAENRQNRMESAAAALESATQRVADANQNLADLGERQSEQRDAQAQKEIDADARVADAAQNLADQKVQLAQNVIDAEQNLADRTVELNQRVADSEQNLADLQISLAQSVTDAKQRQMDDSDAAAQSVYDAEMNLQDLQQREAAKGNPKLLAELAQQTQLRKAQEAVAKAKEEQSKRAEADAKAVKAAQDAEVKGLAAAQKQVEQAKKDQAKGLDQGQDQLLKAQAAETKGVETATKSLQRAEEERAKVSLEAHKLEVSQATETRKALEAQAKAQDALAVAQKKAAEAPLLTLAESQEQDKLTESIQRKTTAMEDAKAKAEEMNAAIADNAEKTQAALDRVDAKFHGQLEARAKTWSGRLHIMLTDLEDFLARVGEKLAKPLQIGGPLAFVAGTLLRGRGGASAAGSAAGGIAGGLGARAAAGGLSDAAIANGFGGLAGGAGGIAAGGAAAGTEAAAGLAAIAAPAALAAAAIAAVGISLFELYEHSKVFHKFVDDAWQNTQKIVQGAWRDVLEPTFDFIGEHWRGLIEIMAPGFYLIVTNWDKIARGAQEMWSIVKPVLGFFVELGLAILIDNFKILWHIGEETFNAVGKVIQVTWRDVIEPVLGFLEDKLGGPVTGAIHKLGDVWSDVWGGMKNVVSSIWGDIEGIITGALGVIGGIVAKVLGVIATIAEHIPGAGDIASTLRDAQHSVQDWGKSDGIGVPSPVSGAVASATYQQTFATGGALGFTPIGQGFVTSRETAIVHEGGSYPEVVIPTDPAHRDNARKLVSWVTPKLMAGGGWLSDLVGGVGGAIGDAAGFVSDIARKGGANVISAAWPTLPTGNDLLGLVPSSFNAVRSAVINAIRGLAGKGSSGAGQGPEVEGTGWQELENFLTVLGIGHRRTSDYREGDPGYHGRGLAADFVGADDSEEGMVAIFNAFHAVGSQMAELIHNPTGGIKDGKDVPGSFWGQATWDAHMNHVHAAIEAATKLHAQAGGSGPASGDYSGDATSWINQALSIDNEPSSWFQGVYDRMMQESGGRNIPQEIHDVNTDNGTPAFGPMQIIEPTFNAYKAPGHGDWHNPVDSTAAAVNYIADRYGDPYHLPSGGYSTGGVLAANWAGVMDSGGTFRPGLNVAMNNTGADEHLAPSPVDGQPLVIEVPLVIDGKEFARATARFTTAEQVRISNARSRT
jgi:hypothetical protein